MHFILSLFCVPIKKVIVILSYLTCANHYTWQQPDLTAYIGAVSRGAEQFSWLVPCYSRYFLPSFVRLLSLGSAMSKEWSHGLFGCFDDCGTCLVTYFCHCYTAGKNAEAVGDSCLLCGLATFVPLANIFFMAQIRSKIREAKGIEGTFVNDLLATCCCPLCMLVQSAQEVKGGPGAMAIARS